MNQQTHSPLPTHTPTPLYIEDGAKGETFLFHDSYGPFGYGRILVGEVFGATPAQRAEFAALILTAVNERPALLQRVAELGEEVGRFRYWTAGLLQDLPDSRDWLDTDTENNLRDLVELRPLPPAKG